MTNISGGSRTARAGVAQDTSRARSGARRWVGLEEASRRLGVSATTLRRWSDEGVIRAFVTPGGHRRFDADSIASLLPAEGGRPTMEQMGETPERIARAYRRSNQRHRMPWVERLDDQQRTAFREDGQVIARELLALLDAPTDADRSAHLRAGSEAAARYGIAAAESGLSASMMVETFLRFRRPFVQEISMVTRRAGLEAADAMELVGRAADAVDQLLLATLRAYEATSARIIAGEHDLRATDRITLHARGIVDPELR